MGWYHRCRRFGRWYYQRDGLFDVEMSHSLCSSYNINLQHRQETWCMFYLPVMFSVSVCMYTHLPVPFTLVFFFTIVLINGRPWAFLTSPIWLSREDYPLVAKAPLQTCHSKGFLLVQIVVWTLSEEWLLTGLWIQHYQVSFCDLYICSPKGRWIIAKLVVGSAESFFIF